MDIPFLLESLFNHNSTYSMRKSKREQKGGFYWLIVQILTFVFRDVLLPLASMMFQLPDFYREKYKQNKEGKFLDENGSILDDQDDPTVRIMEKKIRTILGFIPYPEYTPELDGKGLFWKYLKYCFKISFGLVVGMLGGIYLVLGGMIYMVVKIFNDFTYKPRAITKKYD